MNVFPGSPQASRGQSIAAPDTLTLGVAFSMLAAGVALLGAILLVEPLGKRNLRQEQVSG